MRRIACLFIPHFYVDLCRRAKLSLAHRPLAIAAGATRREIVDASIDALGVYAGMTPKQARAACPILVVVARNEAAELTATRDLLDALETCSPEVEGAAPGACYFDVAGLPVEETAAAGAALGKAGALGLSCAVGIADDKFTARCAARVAGGGVSIVARGGAAAFLAPLPVSLLPLKPGDADRFELLGLRTLGQIAALPVGPLAARFGERARGYVRLARGRDDEALRPRRQQIVYEERFVFDGAVDSLEPLLFALRGCIGRVTEQLGGCAQTCDRVELILEGEGKAPIVVPIALAEPTAAAQVLFDLARVALEAREALGPIEALVVRAAPCGQSPPQMTLLGGSRASRPAALVATLARLRATLDPDNVVMMQPTPTRSRLPERMQQATPIESPRDLETDNAARRPVVGGRPKVAPSGASGAELRSAFCMENARGPALRLVHPPQLIDPPTEQSTRAGPFRLNENWWDRPVERDYYQLMDRARGLLLVFRDLRDDRWYLQGVFD